MLKKKIRDWFHAIVQGEVGRVLESQRWSASNQISQRNLIASWRQCYNAGIVLSLREVGFRVFSQFEEDGILLYLFTLLGTSNQVFVDLGSADGINSNCANLAINHGWTGLFVDGNQRDIQRGRDFYAKHPLTREHQPVFAHEMICRENINEIIQQSGIVGQVDLLSIDIDGNDYWIWDALECISPRVVIIETHVEFGTRPIVVPYNRDYVYPGKHPQYHGASPVAMEKLARKKGYRLVGANNYGFNAVFIRDDLAKEIFPEVAVESILIHPRNKERYALFDEIQDWQFVTV